MPKKTKSSKSRLVKLLVQYSLHLWILVFLVNAVLFYSIHFYLIAQTCMTPAQVQADNRCLYIMGNQVFEQGTKNSPHKGHPCGTDVTSVIPSSHINNQANYLSPNFIAQVCSAPTATPTVPPPTDTPTPTVTPANPTAIPTNVPNATATPSPTVTPISAPTSAVPSPQCLGNTSCVTLVPTQIVNQPGGGANGDEGENGNDDGDNGGANAGGRGNGGGNKGNNGGGNGGTNPFLALLLTLIRAILKLLGLNA